MQGEHSSTMLPQMGDDPRQLLGKDDSPSPQITNAERDPFAKKEHNRAQPTGIYKGSRQRAADLTGEPAYASCGEPKGPAKDAV